MGNISSNSVDALLFDLGGVVIEIDFDRVFSHWALSSNQSLEIIRSKFTFDSNYERHERGEIEALEYFASLRKSMGINITDKEFMAGWNSLYVGEMPGVSTLLSRVGEKLPIYAFTNSNVTHQLVWSKMFKQVLSLFREVFVSSEIGKRKPEPAAFHAISNDIGVKLENILFFDDSLENIEGAEKVGIQTVHVTSPQDIEIDLKAFLV
ncbi:MAG: HAD family phosphatase [Desulfobacterales bacterium]|jgi:putative hydrolase of the HAD superfamily